MNYRVIDEHQIEALGTLFAHLEGVIALAVKDLNDKAQELHDEMIEYFVTHPWMPPAVP